MSEITRRDFINGGLVAACFYQQKHRADKKILILDNRDAFGGHAKRNVLQQRIEKTY